MHYIRVELASGPMDYMVENLTEDFVCPFSGIGYDELSKTEVESNLYNNLLCVGNDDVDQGVAAYQKLVKSLPYAPMSFQKDMEVLSITKGLTPFYNFSGSIDIPWRSSETIVTTYNNGQSREDTTDYSGSTVAYFSETVPAACTGSLTASLQKGNLQRINIENSVQCMPGSFGDNHNIIVLMPYEEPDDAYPRISNAITRV